MELRLVTNSGFEGDFMELIRAFSPYVEYSDKGNAIKIDINGREITLTAYSYTKIDNVTADFINEIQWKSELKRLAKIMLYDYLVYLTGRKLPYGSLTGIRPTKLFHEIQSKGIDAVRYFRDYLRVSSESVDWLERITFNQQGIYGRNINEIDLFINIPICITRCSYCSFISAEYGRIKKSIPFYVSQLCREIENAIQIINENELKIRAIYVGGGTPTSLSAEELASVLNQLKTLNYAEFTVEAGRPDTITDEKLKVMSDCGVTRISVNPQSFNDSTLKKIGRNHDIAKIYEVYKAAREYEFDINMDLIAMLPDEALSDFVNSVNRCIDLSPDNITVHTLALKRGSNLKTDNYNNSIEELPYEMIDYSRKALTEAGYNPYYLYKQKFMSGNLDNTGYCKSGKACVYNIDIMEETHSILACGAGGISKRVYAHENRLERLANPKGIDVYLEREIKILNDKKLFFS